MSARHGSGSCLESQCGEDERRRLSWIRDQLRLNHKSQVSLWANVRPSLKTVNGKQNRIKYKFKNVSRSVWDKAWWYAFNLGIWETGRQLSLHRVPDQPRKIVRPSLKKQNKQPSKLCLVHPKVKQNWI